MSGVTQERNQESQRTGNASSRSCTDDASRAAVHSTREKGKGLDLFREHAVRDGRVQAFGEENTRGGSHRQSSQTIIISMISGLRKKRTDL